MGVRSTSWALAGFLAVASALAGGPTSANPAPPADRAIASAVTPADDLVVAHGQVVIQAKPLKYTTRTGLIPIYNDATGELMARMFIVAYTVEPSQGGRRSRPLTFLWNGGPGSNAGETHLAGFGPKGYIAPATYPQWTSPPSRIGDRPETLLATTDLVFVDPVGTGYSRATNEHNRELLYTVNGDAEAVAEMIRIYRTRLDAFDQPLFIGGESYGTTRAMEVAAALARRRTPLDGVILISGGYSVGQQVPGPLARALQVPYFTAMAHYHKRLPADLQALSRDEAVSRATAWARTEYVSSLEKLDGLTPEQRSALLAQLQRYTGVDPRFVDPKTLVLTKDVALDRLLDDKNLELGRYDSRMSAKRRNLAQPWAPTLDPSIIPMLDLMQGTSPSLIEYIRGPLGYRNDLLYKGPFGEGFHPQPLIYVAPGIADDWMSVLWEQHGDAAARAEAQRARASAPPALKRAMQLEPQMLVFNVTGMYDASCAEKDEAVARSDPEFRKRVRNGCYPAGHMIYTDAEVRRTFQRDFSRFVSDALAANHQP